MSSEDSSFVPIELSDQELAEVSGGIDISFSGSMFEQIDEFSAQFSKSKHRGSSISKSSRKFFSSFQFSGSGFESVNDVLMVIAGLSKLFGR